MRFLIPLLATLALAACRPQPADKEWDTENVVTKKDVPKIKFSFAMAADMGKMKPPTTVKTTTEEDRMAQFAALQEQFLSEAAQIKESPESGLLFWRYFMHYGSSADQKPLPEPYGEIASPAASQIERALHMSNDEAREAITELDAELKQMFRTMALNNDASSNNERMLELFIKWYERIGSMSRQGQPALEESFPEISAVVRDQHAQQFSTTEH